LLRRHSSSVNGSEAYKHAGAPIYAVRVAVRALLFDFDGLIVDTESPSLASWRWVYQQHGQELTLDRWSAAVGTIDGFDPVAHLTELTGDSPRADVLRRRPEHELLLTEAELLRPGIAEYLADAERLGLLKAIVSSASRAWIDLHLGRLERLPGWDAIVTADHDAERAKPRPTLYLEALEALGVAAADALALEDSPNGIQAARAAGIRVVGVPNPVTAGLGLDAADLVVGSLADLPLAALLARLE
jgi:HAD superfamily hydrolase (TIGR01509 family)